MTMSISTTAPPVAAPEILTPEQALAAARALRPRLIEEQAETEQRTRHSPELHEEFLRSGFYHLLRPRTFGGYEFDLPSYMGVMRELARGCMSTAWCVCLASGHNLQAASWWPEKTQRELFAGDYFAAPATVVPGGQLVRGDGGWVLTSVQPYASGAPYSTHFMGHALVPGDSPEAPPGLATFLAPRESWTMLDDWGSTLGLRGSGSNTLRFDGAVLPEDWVLEGRTQFDMDVSDGTPGLQLHGNPMYAGRALGFFTVELATLAIGGVLGALDEYEQLLLTRKTSRPPVTLRVEDHDYAGWYGIAVARLTAAEAVADRAAQMYMEFCERGASGGAPFSYADDMLINMLGREALTMAWKVMEDTIVRTSGSSTAVQGSRLERIWRDMTMAWGHVNSILRDAMARDYTWNTLGVNR